MIFKKKDKIKLNWIIKRLDDKERWMDNKKKIGWQGKNGWIIKKDLT